MDESAKYSELVARLREFGLTDEPDQLAETTQLFLHDAAQMVETMKTAFTRGDAAGLGRAAHRRKGAALNLGAVQVAAPARRIEEDVRRGEVADAPGSLNAIERELKDVGVFLRALAQAGAKA